METTLRVRNDTRFVIRGCFSSIRGNRNTAAAGSQCQGGVCTNKDLVEIYTDETSFFKNATLELVPLEIKFLGHSANVTVGFPRENNSINYSGIDEDARGVPEECGWTRALRYIGESYFPSWIVEVKYKESPPLVNNLIETQKFTGSGNVVSMIRESLH